ncbi:NAD-dependent epimerase/dehydratase family protein [Cohnella faecalis]|uniref:NAD-dependent epimerase/dehydratase family protein n=1 Tax=Cohnella faecalis TaxID=2315694 RepID=A0A398CS87_9BACL|nr:NAD-dependent epimerase/dehydratase family protein [Cohnella faecalis]RIE04099.1 NAD-dependent epimerase/dehydratase family protein [Cohnella faecalis]
MKAVVTGGAGFIGSHLVDALIGLSFDEVHVIDDLSSGSMHIHPAAAFHRLDIRSEACREAIIGTKPDVVFHLAAQMDVSRSIADPKHDAEVNIAGTINLLEACRLASVPKFIFASTSAVYGNLQKSRMTEADPVHPISYYGLSKLSAESYIRIYSELYGLSYTILRYANVYGPRQTPKGEGGVIAVFANKIKAGDALPVHGDGEQTRDFIYVSDIVRANIAAIDEGHRETIQVGTARGTSINELIKALSEIRGEKLTAKHGPERIGDIKISCLDNRKAKKLLRWKPQTDLKEGLLATLRASLD